MTLFGCWAPVVALGLGLFMVIMFIIIQAGRDVRPPNAQVIPHLTKRTLGPFSVQTERTYRITDTFDSVQVWYEQVLQNPPERRDVASGCVIVEQTDGSRFIEQYSFVAICENVNEQKVSVTTITSLNLFEGDKK